MDVMQRLVGIARDDGRRLQLLAIRAHPALPQARKGNWLPILRAHHIRAPAGRASGLRARSLLLPFIEAVGRDETAPPPHGIAEGRLVEDGIAARIDEQT